MTVKEHIDNLTNEQLNQFIKFHYIEDEWDIIENKSIKIDTPKLTYKFSLITSQRRYDRYITKFYQDENGKFWRTDGIPKGGDNEWKDYFGTIHEITEKQYIICRDFWKLDFVSC